MISEMRNTLLKSLLCLTLVETIVCGRVPLDLKGAVLKRATADMNLKEGPKHFVIPIIENVSSQGLSLDERIMNDAQTDKEMTTTTSSPQKLASIPHDKMKTFEEVQNDTSPSPVSLFPEPMRMTLSNNGSDDDSLNKNMKGTSEEFEIDPIPSYGIPLAPPLGLMPDDYAAVTTRFGYPYGYARFANNQPPLYAMLRRLFSSFGIFG